MPAGDIYRMTTVLEIHSVRTVNVLYYRQQNADGANDPRQDLAEGFVSQCWDAGIENVLSNEVVFSCQLVQRVEPTTGPPASFFPNARTGNIVDESLPAQRAMVIQQISTTPGPGGRGRLYLPGCPESEEILQVLQEDQLARLKIAAGRYNLIYTENGVTFEPGIYTGVVPTFKQSATVVARARLYSQRNRQTVLCV